MNQNLNLAKIKKNDEWYTFLEDIEKEMELFKHHFKNKIIYCNCDDPKFSNFWKFFNDNFKELKLKKLYATFLNEEESFLYEKTNEEVKKTKLKSNGDFLSFECVEIFKKADLIITNPPFSLIQNFYELLKKHSKSFILIVPPNALSRPIIWKDFQKNKVRVSNNSIGKFFNHNNRNLLAAGIWISDLDFQKNNYIKLNNSISNIKKQFIDFPKYLIVEKSRHIPNDYFLEMAVPLTYLKFHDPKLFEILEIVRPFKNDRPIFIKCFIIRKFKNDGTLNYIPEKELSLF